MRHVLYSTYHGVFIFRQTIFQEYQTFGGIGGVLTVWIAAHQFGKVTKRSSCMLRIAIATVNAKEPLQRTVIQRHIGQATHVHDIIDIRMGRVKANKTIDGSLR